MIDLTRSPFAAQHFIKGVRLMKFSIIGFSVFLCLSIFLVIVGKVYQASDSGQQTVREEARKYAAELYPQLELQGAAFSSVDSDGDGYISGTITLRDPRTGKVQQLNIECAAPPIVLHMGCRNQRMQSNYR